MRRLLRRAKATPKRPSGTLHHGSKSSCARDVVLVQQTIAATAPRSKLAWPRVSSMEGLAEGPLVTPIDSHHINACRWIWAARALEEFTRLPDAFSGLTPYALDVRTVFAQPRQVEA